MPPGQDPAQEKWGSAWNEAKEGDFAAEFAGALEAERKRLADDADDGDRTFEPPLSRQDCIHGMYFEDAIERALDAARSVSERS